MKVIDFDSDNSLLELFLAFPKHLYSTDPHWLADPDEARWLSAVARRNYIVLEEDKVCGRAAVMVNPSLRDETDLPYGQIGFFECLNDPAIANCLINASFMWFRSNLPVVKTILAPIEFDTWHAYRLRTRGFDQPSFLMEPYNPSYYPDLFSALNFTPVSHYVTKTVDDLSNLPAAWEPYHRNVLAQGYSFRSINPARLEEEMTLIYHLSLDIFHENLLFVNITEDEFHALYAGIAGKIDPDLLIFVLDPNGDPVGFSFIVPDHHQPGLANIKTMGILPSEKRKGVGAALTYETYQRLRAKGFFRVNHCLMRAGNRADQFDRGLAEITREYALYACVI